MKRKSITIMLVLVMLASMLTGCTADIDGEYKGYSNGFNYNDHRLKSSVMCAARSEKTEFDVDDVTLDFYFGWWERQPSDPSYPGIKSLLGYALYFCNEQIETKTNINTEDYKNIPGHYFIKEIPTDEFNSDKYSISMKKSIGRVFKQSESFTVPKELFDQKRGTILFSFHTVILLLENSQFYNYREEYIRIEYEFIDDNTVRISKF